MEIDYEVWPLIKIVNLFRSYCYGFLSHFQVFWDWFHHLGFELGWSIHFLFNWKLGIIGTVSYLTKQGL